MFLPKIRYWWPQKLKKVAMFILDLHTESYVTNELDELTDLLYV